MEKCKICGKTMGSFAANLLVEYLGERARQYDMRLYLEQSSLYIYGMRGIALHKASRQGHPIPHAMHPGNHLPPLFTGVGGFIKMGCRAKLMLAPTPPIRALNMLWLQR